MQRPTPPPVPPAPRREPDPVPVVIVSGTRPVKRRRSSGGAGVAAALLVAAAAVVAGVAGVVAWPFIQPALRQVNRQPKKRQVAAAEPRPDASRENQASREEQAVPAAERTAKQEQSAATPPTAPPVAAPASAAASAQPPAPADPEPAPIPEPTPDPAPSASALASDRTVAPPPASPAVMIGEAVPPMREEEGATPRDAEQAAAEVARGIATAAAALRRHDLAAAEQALAVADEAAGGDVALETRVSRWRLIVAYAGQLDEHLARAVASANEGREYTIGERTISIIELGPTTFAYKERGKVTRGPRGELPRVVERAILAAWFDGDPRPANAIFVGLHRLLDDEPDLDRVRAAWQEAAAGDEAAASILPLLDDPALVPPR